MTEPLNEYGIEWLKSEHDRLNRATQWAYVQTLHDHVITAQNEFNTALKKYRDTYRT